MSALSRHGSKIIKVDPNGEIEWAMPCRESIRSDSHQVSLLLGSRHLEISGSPARVMQANNVFGSQDIIACMRSMVGHVESVLGIALPSNLEQWRVSRVDVAHNYWMDSPSAVRQALLCLRNAEGGRLQVRAESESVYWSPRSRWRSGKAYFKGPHLAKQVKNGTATASDMQILAAGHILRLELALRGHWWRRQSRQWWTFTSADFDQQHKEFFGRVIGGMGVVNVSELRERCVIAANGNRGAGMAAWRTWCAIRQEGYENTRATMARSTFARHRKILQLAGLSFADLHSGNVIPLRRQMLVLDEPVRSWEECLRRVA